MSKELDNLASQYRKRQILAALGAEIGFLAPYALSSKIGNTPIFASALSSMFGGLAGVGIANLTMDKSTQEKVDLMTKDPNKLLRSIGEEKKPNKYLKDIKKKASVFRKAKTLAERGKIPLIGGLAGALLGASGASSKFKKYPDSAKKKLRVSGAISGAITGAGTGLFLNSIFGKAYRSGSRSYGGGYKYRSSGGGGYRSSSYGSSQGKTIFDVMPNMKGVKTKADAKTVYRRYAMKSHPDKGGSAEKFKEINDTMNKFKGSKEWSKLAFLFPFFRRH